MNKIKVEEENKCISCTLCVITGNHTIESLKGANEIVTTKSIIGFCTLKQQISYNHIESEKQLVVDIITDCSHYIEKTKE